MSDVTSIPVKHQDSQIALEATLRPGNKVCVESFAVRGLQVYILPVGDPELLWLGYIGARIGWDTAGVDCFTVAWLTSRTSETRGMNILLLEVENSTCDDRQTRRGKDGQTKEINSAVGHGAKAPRWRRRR